MRTQFMKFTLALLAAGAVLCGLHDVAQARAERVPGLRLVNSARHQAPHVTVLYTLGTKPLVSVDDRQMNIQEVRHVVAASTGGQTVDLSPVDLPQVGFRPAYNFVVLVFHTQPKFFWKNADGSTPTDPRGAAPADSLQAAKVIAIPKARLEQLAAEQGQPEFVRIDL